MTPAEVSSPFSPHWALYPRSYVAPRAPSPIPPIDGDLTKDFWQQAPWSDNFDDIRGENDAPPDERPRAACRTRMKMLWDDEYLYIGALLTSDMAVEANFTKRNSPIFQRDSDFEVFVDPLGSCHNYKEFEVNALNTVWNLMLDKPYGDHGVEHSGRIAKPGDALYYEVQHQKSATRIVSGRLNDPNGATWSVEVAMAYKDLLSHIPTKDLPKAGDRWRINFSRVEKQGDINWTWQPQIIYNADEGKFSGYVNMHLPDAWGYLVFGGSADESEVRDPTWPARLAAMNVYYAQHQYKTEQGRFADSMDQLLNYVDSEIVTPFTIEIQRTTLQELKGKSESGDGFLAIVGCSDGRTSSVRDDRLITVHSQLGSPVYENDPTDLALN